MRQVYAFTLIELLVVISIIALLVAILLPALSAARDTARAMHCGTQMRQVGQAWHQFAGDFNGRGPGYAESPGGTSEHTWGSWLNHFIWEARIVTLPEYMGPIQKFNGFSSEYGGMLEPGPYPGNLVCPMVAQFGEGLVARPWISNWNATGGNPWPHFQVHRSDGPYGQIMRNHPFHPDAHVALGTRLSQFRRPSTSFLVYEADRGWDGGVYSSSEQSAVGQITPENRSTRAFTGVGGYMFRHPGMTMNALLADGHVERLGADPDEFGPERFAVD